MPSTRITAGKAVACSFALATALLSSAAVAQEQYESLEKFGLADVAEVANCVAKQIPSQLSVDFVQTYWGPTVKQGNACVQSSSVTPDDTKNRVRPIFLNGLNVCTKRRYTSDGDVWVRRVAYGTATIAAKGVRGWDSNQSLLQKYIHATVECQPKD